MVSPHWRAKNAKINHHASSSCRRRSTTNEGHDGVVLLSSAHIIVHLGYVSDGVDPGRVVGGRHPCHCFVDVVFPAGEGSPLSLADTGGETALRYFFSSEQPAGEQQSRQQQGRTGLCHEPLWPGRRPLCILRCEMWAGLRGDDKESARRVIMQSLTNRQTCSGCPGYSVCSVGLQRIMNNSVFLLLGLVLGLPQLPTDGDPNAEVPSWSSASSSSLVASLCLRFTSKMNDRRAFFPTPRRPLRPDRLRLTPRPTVLSVSSFS